MRVENIQIVKDRLQFIDTFTTTRNFYKGRDKIERKEGKGWNHPYRHFVALEYYLLLTCFDILGQTDEFIDFKSWLCSNKNDLQKKLEEIIKQTESFDFANRVAMIYDEYNLIYGVKRSFYRFIYNDLSEENRKLLFDSIEISKLDNQGKYDLSFKCTNEKKANFLFFMRNSFTHSGLSLASGAGGLTDWFDGRPIKFPGDKQESYYWEKVYYVIKRDYKIIYSVIKWPTLLRKIIEETMNDNY